MFSSIVFRWVMYFLSLLYLAISVLSLTTRLMLSCLSYSRFSIIPLNFSSCMLNSLMLRSTASCSSPMTHFLVAADIPSALSLMRATLAGSFRRGGCGVGTAATRRPPLRHPGPALRRPLRTPRRFGFSYASHDAGPAGTHGGMEIRLRFNASARRDARHFRSGTARRTLPWSVVGTVPVPGPVQVV